VSSLSFVQRLRERVPAWQWLIVVASVWALIPVVMAFTVRNRCSDADPACVYHHYTLVTLKGLWVLALVGAPVVINMAVGAALHVKVSRRSAFAGRAAWYLVVLSYPVSFVGLVIVGVVMLISAPVATWAVALAPLPPDPSDPLARGGGYFGGRSLAGR
jgi:hypothetical protein